MITFSEAWLAILVGGVVTLVTTPFVRRLALRLNALEQVGKRQIHREVMPRMGGAGIFLGLMAGLVWLQFCGALSPVSSGSVAAVLLGVPLALGIGVFDDFWPMRSNVKLLLQIGLGGIAYWAGFRIEQISFGVGFSYELGWIALPITVIWVSGIMNAINLIDGSDGLAAGVCSAAFAAIGLFAYLTGNVEVALICGVSAGAALAFLRYNFSPASIFMGDSGSMLLGYLLAVTSMSLSSAGNAIPIYLPLLFIAFPIVDMTVAISRRTVRSIYIPSDRSMADWSKMLRFVAREVFSADGDHVHHRLLSRGMSQRQVALLLYGFSVLTSAVAFFLFYLPAPLSWALLLGVGLVMRHLVLSLEYVEFAPHHIRKKELCAENEIEQRPVLHRRVS